ncbi:DeoR/GlpR family DNA-binding transcription regulator [Rarobacter incanus]|uniref:Lactose phosphotransferase system repressor n=1 Tax=Rarobacter incanus TaxID=153494 RepID=A0A542SQ21_9MICO|nr:DeoR/GlpR family DNA-binding transcription regulator [Rarobacter incanus]TQK76713.1 DeoR family transcriptional regulator [Rarobacter incanus]
MYAKERRRVIIDLLYSEGRVAVSDLAIRFDVASETIRRDLDALASADMLSRVHGGAIPRSTDPVEADLPTRLMTHTATKRRIAAVAARYLPSAPGGSVLLDAGSTTVELASYLHGHGLRVITNGLPVAEALVQLEAPGLHILPGNVRGITHAAVGSETVAALGRLHADVVFIGCNGFGEYGLSTQDPDEAATKSALVAAAELRVVVADSSKFAKRQLVTFAQLSDIDVLVTDTDLPDDRGSELERAGIEVVRA